MQIKNKIYNIRINNTYIINIYIILINYQTIDLLLSSLLKGPYYTFVVWWNVSFCHLSYYFFISSINVGFLMLQLCSVYFDIYIKILNNLHKYHISSLKVKIFFIRILFFIFSIQDGDEVKIFVKSFKYLIYMYKILYLIRINYKYFI